ncbi:MAG TPA: hypothetical protein VFK02_19350 [Kofleriaceae bacterium]|nr:hypothetical protein [Kofleriaceae bacterium]
MLDEQPIPGYRAIAAGRAAMRKSCWDTTHPAAEAQASRGSRAQRSAYLVLGYGRRSNGVREVVMWRVSILIFIACLVRTAAAGERAGVAMADAVTAEDRALVLNGMGVRKGTVAGAAFASALFSIWLGPDPSSKARQDGLLGN